MEEKERQALISIEGKIGIALGLAGLGGAGALFVLPHPASDYVGWSLIAFSAAGVLALAIYDVVGRRSSGNKSSHFDSPPVQKVEVRLKPGPPYEMVEVRNGRTLSSVRIGLVTTGGMSLSNCKLYVEKIAPQPPLPGGLPILLADQNFTIRHDDPERFVELAVHWDHVDKIRFSSQPGWFAETLNYIDDHVPRTIELRIKGEPEYEKSVTFKIWTDESRRLHLRSL